MPHRRQWVISFSALMLACPVIVTLQVLQLPVKVQTCSITADILLLSIQKNYYSRPSAYVVECCISCKCYRCLCYLLVLSAPKVFSRPVWIVVLPGNRLTNQFLFCIGSVVFFFLTRERRGWPRILNRGIVCWKRIDCQLLHSLNILYGCSWRPDSVVNNHRNVKWVASRSEMCKCIWSGAVLSDRWTKIPERKTV